MHVRPDRYLMKFGDETICRMIAVHNRALMFTDLEATVKRADMMDTQAGTTEKNDAAEVANDGFEAMMNGEGDVVGRFKNKVQSAVANVMPDGVWPANTARRRNLAPRKK